MKDKVKYWGVSCKSITEMSKIFINYITGKIKKFPFAEGPIALETQDINEFLVELLNNKILTINSQPRVNAVKSSDPKFGWGPGNGYCYQKAYIEVLVHPKLINVLVDHLWKYENVTFQAINKKGEKFQNVQDNDVNAVTWGVFRGKEIIQPTVVDHQAFIIWKDECLNTFTNVWAPIYKPQVDKEGKLVGGDEASINFLQECEDSMYLVNIVDNDFIEGDLPNIMHTFITENQEVINSIE